MIEIEWETTPGRAALNHILYNGSKVATMRESGWYASANGMVRIEEGALVLLTPLVVPYSRTVKVYEDVIVAVPLTDPGWTIRKVTTLPAGTTTADLEHPEHGKRTAILEKANGDVATTQAVRTEFKLAGVYSGTPGSETAWHGHVLIELLLAQYGEQ